VREIGDLPPGEWHIPIVFFNSEGEEAMTLALWMVQIVLALFIAVGSFVFVPVG